MAEVSSGGFCAVTQVTKPQHANPPPFNPLKDQFTEGLSTINALISTPFSTLTIVAVEHVQTLNKLSDHFLLICSVREVWDLCRLIQI